MYETFYGFRERPFDLAANPRFIHWTPQHQEALSNVQYGLTSRKGLTLLLGDAGTGKTSVLTAAVEALNGSATFCLLNNPTLTRQEFLEALADKFGLSAQAALSKTRMLAEIEVKLADARRERRVAALVVDEAQSLPDELLEEIRLLVNLVIDGETLLPVILAGQPELAVRLNRESLRQIKQRVALRCSLAPLDLPQTGGYIARRIQVAGGKSFQVFTREAVGAIHEASRGIPRLISVICDNALVSGFALGARPVTCAIVEEVCRDFDLCQDASAGQEAPSSASPSPTAVSPAPPAAADGDNEATAAVAAASQAAERPMFGGFATTRRFLRF